MDNFAEIITSHDTYVNGVPHETFREMRALQPVAWTEESRWGPRFLESHQVRRRALRESPRRAVLEPPRNSHGGHGRRGDRGATHDDGDGFARAHATSPARVARPFTPRAVHGYEDAVRDLAREVLDEPARAREEFDFVKSVARELPMKMLGRLLGLPDDDLDWLVSRGDALIGNTDPDFTDFVVDQTDTSAYRLLPFRSPVVPRALRVRPAGAGGPAHTPTHDVLSALLEPNAEGDHLDDAPSRTSSR